SDGYSTIYDSAAALMAGLPQAVDAAGKRAKAVATLIPGQIAAGIIAGRDLVVQAANALATAETDALTNQANIDEARQQIKDLLGANAKGYTEAQRQAE